MHFVTTKIIKNIWCENSLHFDSSTICKSCFLVDKDYNKKCKYLVSRVYYGDDCEKEYCEYCGECLSVEMEDECRVCDQDDWLNEVFIDHPKRISGVASVCAENVISDPAHSPVKRSAIGKIFKKSNRVCRKLKFN
uniref:PlxyGVORF77 protein n=1 Tax=Plutella xylostella granulovirus TaxID=98383 RepID=A0A1B2CSI7_9BBAC|nr:PlxyGVORF77 protein [Plutella xylostella granulovirus]